MTKLFCKILLSTMLLITITFSPVYAFRCGSDIVSRWDSRQQVYDRCGNPFQTGSTQVNDNGVIKYGETWYYNCGYDDFVYAVIFIDNIVFKEYPIKRGEGKGQCH